VQASRNSISSGWRKLTRFAGVLTRSPPGKFFGELETSYARSLKLSTVTAGGVNLFRSRQEIKQSNDAWFYTVFQLEGSAEIEQDDRRAAQNRGYHAD
jgi:AraC family transcriptional activator of tynA and feaB